MQEQIDDIINLAPPIYQHKYWGTLAFRRHCAMDIALKLSKKFKLVCYVDNGFLADFRGVAYEIKVLDDYNVLIESCGKYKILSVFDMLKLIDGKASSKLIEDFINLDFTLDERSF